MRGVLLILVGLLIACAPLEDDLRSVTNPDVNSGGAEAEELDEPRREVPPSVMVARTITPTIYDDGLACPGGCDAHVVLHPSVNGTVNAFRPPADSRRQPQKCVSGEPCFVCFGRGGDTCALATYRGSGPPENKFDFTTDYYRANCGRDDLPEALRGACRGFY
ncbi:MAG: hypothetical protein AAF830_13400, partial [Pseudomonadota bacterium]